MEFSNQEINIQKILERSIDFLSKNRNSNGFWEDFTTLAGKSDEWVTAYVANILSEVKLKQCKKLAINAWKKLQQRRHLTFGWGYNGFVPQDADSTIWVLRLCKTLEIKNSIRVFLARKFLERHQGKNGGISTYHDPFRIRNFTGLSKLEKFSGWCSPHCCVTAAAPTILSNGAKKKSIQYIRSLQLSEGNWKGYWWADHEYTTLLAIQSLDKSGDQQDQKRILSAGKWAYDRFDEKSYIFSAKLQQISPFATACGAKVLLQTKNPLYDEKIFSILQWIKNSQLENGSWKSSACLQIPPPNVKDPYKYDSQFKLENGSICVDNESNYTTATVISFLLSLGEKYHQ